MTKARQDRLLAALIAKLPVGEGPWRREERVAWLRMMATAFDVVYGPCAQIAIAPADARWEAAADACEDVPAAGSEDLTSFPGSTAASADDLAPRLVSREGALSRRQRPARRFLVDQDGFAMGDGQPIAMEDLPEGVTLWDERTGLECGDVTTILWRDIGTTRRSLPCGVTLKPASEFRSSLNSSIFG